MASEILINAGAGETRAALVEDGVLQGLVIAPVTAAGPRVGDIHMGRVTRVMAAMQAAFVDIGADRDAFLALRDAPALHEGQMLAVQVTRLPMGEKGAKLTAKVALPPALEARAKMARPPALLQAGPDAVEMALKTWRGDAVVTDDARLAERLNATLAKDELFARHELEDQIGLLFGKRVPLPCGGWITIEKTEGMTAIDVNSGSFAASGGRAQTARTVNGEAALVAARQIRLRGIGGLIVLDFIQMEQGHDAITDMLRAELARDGLVSDILPMNGHGVVSIARQRLAAPLARSAGQEMLRAIERAARAAPGREIAVRAAPALLAWLADPAIRAGLDRRGVGRVRGVDEAREDFDVST